MLAKGYPADDDALKAVIGEMVVTILRRLSKRGSVVKSGTSRDAQWALALRSCDVHGGSIDSELGIVHAHVNQGTAYKPLRYQLPTGTQNGDRYPRSFRDRAMPMSELRAAAVPPLSIVCDVCRNEMKVVLSIAPSSAPCTYTNVPSITDMKSFTVDDLPPLAGAAASTP